MKLGSRLGLRGKMVMVAGASVAFVAVTLVAICALQMRAVMEDELAKRGRAAGLQLARDLSVALNAGDHGRVGKLAAGTLLQVPDAAYVVVRGKSGEVTFQILQPEVSEALGDGKVPGPEDSRGETVAQRKLKLSGLRLLDISVPVRGDVESLGSIQLGLRLDSVAVQVQGMTVRAIGFGVVLSALCLGGVMLLARQSTVPLQRLSQVAAGIARGDLQQSVEVEGEDEIAVLAQSFQTMATELRRMLVDLRAAASEVQGESKTMLSTATQQAAMASQQATALTETSSTVKEIAQTSKFAADHADSVIKVTQKAEEFSQEGQDVIQQTIDGMEKLDDQVRAIAITITDLTERTIQIGDIIATVKELAERSDMLALNAAIEAAKAGEHGRGFSVVAMEMRNLAEQSKHAAGQVRQILGEVQKVTRAAVVATEEGSKRAQSTVVMAQSAGDTILRLAGVCQESSLAGRQIAGNTRQQTAGVEQIVQALNELSGAQTETVAGTQAIEKAAGNLQVLASRLSDLVSRYRA